LALYSGIASIDGLKQDKNKKQKPTKQKNRWVVLLSNTLLVYKDDKLSSNKEPILTIHGEDILAVNNVQKRGGGKLQMFEMATRHTSEVFAAEDEKEFQSYVLSPLLCQKKKKKKKASH